MRLLAGAMLLAGLWSCTNEKTELPIMGQEEVVRVDRDGETAFDTIVHAIPDFAFTDQDGNKVTGSTFNGQVYVVDFFFTSCPTICPKMKAQMLRVYEEFEDEKNLSILSHSIDTRHDSVPVLKKYATKLGIESDKWHLVTGDHDEIYSMAEEYLVNAAIDDGAPGGYLHSGAFILVDQQKHIRGYYDGTVTEDVDKMMDDIKTLLGESK